MMDRSNLNWEGKSILIVEDEETNFAYLDSALKITSAKIVWANHGEEALKLIQKGSTFDLILMDIKMPVMNGYDATVEIKKINPQQKIIAQTAYARREDYKEIIKAGFDDYLVKPIIPDDLYEVVARNLLL